VGNHQSSVLIGAESFDNLAWPLAWKGDSAFDDRLRAAISMIISIPTSRNERINISVVPSNVFAKPIEMA
jgi:hypothetical protein